MRVITAIQELSKLNPDEQVVISWFNKDTYESYYNDEKEIEVAEWDTVVEYISTNETYWQQVVWSIEEAVSMFKGRVKV